MESNFFLTEDCQITIVTRYKVFLLVHFKRNNIFVYLVFFSLLVCSELLNDAWLICSFGFFFVPEALMR